MKILYMLLILNSTAFARDLGQWKSNDPITTEWYKNLMQPDAPSTSCCGEAYAYYCDDYFTRDGKNFCKITDDRDDEPRMRPHIDIGTEIEIPSNKLKWDKGNPTGHGIIFLSLGRHVYCYVQDSGT